MNMRLKAALNFPTVVVAIGTAIACFYMFSFLFPITDNAFVATNNTPVSATVSGYVTNIHVKNGDYVKKGQPIITVFQEPYRYALDKASADYKGAQLKLETMQKELERDTELLSAARQLYEKINIEYELKKQTAVSESVSGLEVAKLKYEVGEQQNKVNALSKQIEVDGKAIKEQEQIIQALKAVLENAKVNMDETIVKALCDGYVQNLFVSLRTPIKANDPIFSIVGSEETYIQANFNETDLRNVKVGDEAIIIPRTYFGSKVYHGIVMSEYWAADRQFTSEKSQLQYVKNENQWLLLPQRMPVQIKITDLDPNFPMRTGMSAYVYIKTK